MPPAIATVGLIQPVVINGDSNVLIAGERRLRAHKLLQRTEIEAISLDSLSPAQQHLIELEENVKRKNLTWQEHTDAVIRYHELRCSEDAEHTEMKSSVELGISYKKLNKDLAIAAAARKDPSLLETPKYNTAYEKTVREKQRVQQAALAQIDTGISAPIPQERSADLIHTDFIEWASTYSGDLFDFIHCDFPYGIDFHKSGSAFRKESL